ncbi:MAG: hypothetical protein OEZ02_08300, partial [Anaerolineae bacterium]|nr:hypothetical protein [Anaerolineae bacterium]
IMLADDPEKMTQARKTITIAALGIFPVAWLPMALWAYGVIDSYYAALGVFIAAEMAVLVWGIRAARMASKEVMDAAEVEL